MDVKLMMMMMMMMIRVKTNFSMLNNTEGAKNTPFSPITPKPMTSAKNVTYKKDAP